MSIGWQIFLEVDNLIYVEGFPSDRFPPVPKWRNILHEIDLVPSCTFQPELPVASGPYLNMRIRVCILSENTNLPVPDRRLKLVTDQHEKCTFK